MSIGLIILGILCLAYYIFLWAHGLDFSIVWLCCAAVLICGGLIRSYMLRHEIHLPGAVKVTGGIIITIGIIFFVVVEGMIFHGMMRKADSNLNYIIVLGAQVRGETPSKALRKRLERAAVYLKENPDTRAVLSGGQGRDEIITEAEAMYRYLKNAGIAEERLIKEENSTNTEENLRYSAEMIGDKSARTGVVTNNFHVFRAVELAKKQGYTNVSGIPAKSDPVNQPHYIIREFFAVVKEKIVGNI